MLVSSVLPGLCLLGIILSGEEVLSVVILTTLAVMFYGSMFSGIFSPHRNQKMISKSKPPLTSN